MKLVIAGYKKLPDAHWATYYAVYGFPDTTYIIFNPMKSASEIDRNFAQGKDFEAAMGEDGMKKLAELTAATIESSQTQLFAVNPHMSYPADEWVREILNSGRLKQRLPWPRNQRKSRLRIIKASCRRIRIAGTLS